MFVKNDSPLEKDDELANAAVEVAVRLLKRAAAIRIDGETRSLDPADIGIVATHRAMNAAMELKLPSSLRGRVVVDTPERWQGLERDVMIAIHPLSGVLQPSAFDLETGRLCVMASRHRGGLVLVSRDHIPETLDANIPSAEQAVGRPDTTGRGHEMHSRLWATLSAGGRIVSV